MFSDISQWCLLLSMLVCSELSTTDLMHVSQKGSFDQENWSSKPSVPTRQGSAIGAALAARVEVPPGEKRDVVFSLAWDSPEVKFLKGKSYHR
jgi:non-lysosomal glucosylceramidase